MSQPWDYIAKLVCIGDSGTGKSSLTVRLCEGRFSAQHDVTIGVEFGSRIVSVGPPASLALNINSPAASASGATTTIDQSTPPASTPGKAPPTRQSRPQPQGSPSSPSTQRQKRMKLSLWDTAGQETYKSITRSYFRGASGALLVFDITRRQTFDSVTSWLNDLRQIAEEGIVVILVGNKSDLTSDSLVSDDVSQGAGGDGDGDGGRGRDASGRPDEGVNKRAVSRAEAEEWCRKNRVMTYVETSAKSGEGVERAFLEVAERIYQNIEAGKYDLNDRRSGVKGPGAGGGRAGPGAGGGQGAVLLGVNDVGGMGNKGWTGGCC